MENGYSKEAPPSSSPLSTLSALGTVTRSTPFELEPSQPPASTPELKSAGLTEARTAEGTSSLAAATASRTLARKPSTSLQPPIYVEASPARTIYMLVDPKDHTPKHDDQTTRSSPSCCEWLLSFFKSHQDAKGHLIKAKDYAQYLGQSKLLSARDEDFDGDRDDENFYFDLKP